MTYTLLQSHTAAFWGFADVVKALLDSGCNVNHQNEGSLWTPLHAATFQEHGKVSQNIQIRGSIIKKKRVNCDI